MLAIVDTFFIPCNLSTALCSVSTSLQNAKAEEGFPDAGMLLAVKTEQN